MLYTYTCSDGGWARARWCVFGFYSHHAVSLPWTYSSREVICISRYQWQYHELRHGVFVGDMMLIRKRLWETHSLSALIDWFTNLSMRIGSKEALLQHRSTEHSLGKHGESYPQIYSVLRRDWRWDDELFVIVIYLHISHLFTHLLI